MPRNSHHNSQSPTPLSDTESDIYNSKPAPKKKQSKSKSKSTPRHKQSRGSHRRASSTEKSKTLPNQKDLEAMDTSEVKELIPTINLHIRILMRREKATSLIPPPPTASERNMLEAQYADCEYPDDLAPYLLPPNPLIRISNRVSDTYYNTIEMMLRRWGLARFTFDWEGNFDDAFNQISVQFFLKTFILAVSTGEYGLRPLKIYREPIQLAAIVFRVFKNLRTAYRSQINNPLILQDRYESNESRKEKGKRTSEYREFLKESGVRREIVSIFQKKNYAIMGDFQEVEIKIGGRVQKERRVYYPLWWSHKMVTLMTFLESNIQLSSQLTIKRQGSKRIPITYLPSSSQDFQDVPERLPSDLYSDEFMSILIPSMLNRYEKKPPVLPHEIKYIFPEPEAMVAYDSDDSLASLSSEDTDASETINGSGTDVEPGDVEMPDGEREKYDDTRERSDTPRLSRVTSGSNQGSIVETSSHPTSSDALILYSASDINSRTPGLPNDGSSSSPAESTTNNNELQVALQSQQAILDEQLSTLSIGYEAKYKQKLEAELTAMRTSIENEMRAAIENEMRAAIEEEKRKMLSAINNELSENRIQMTSQINAEREQLNAEKERLSAEKEHIEQVVIAEKERISAAIVAEKARIDNAVLAERERLELERRQFQIGKGAMTQIQQRYQSTSNHAYPPS